VDADTHIGRRIREVRAWRGLTLRTAADLAGLSYGYLGKVERGEKAVTSRRTLETLAYALRVSPVELTGKPWAPADPIAAEAHAALHAIETALEATELGHDPGGPVRTWEAIAADVGLLVEAMHVHADYAAQGAMVPRLLAELHALYVREPRHRRDALLGMVRVYASATWTTKAIGGRGLPSLAARLAYETAETLGEPAWVGFAAWLRADAGGALDRATQYRRSVTAAEALTRHADCEDVLQAVGMLHLSAALASAARGDRETTETHLREADQLANAMDAETGAFGHLWFGRANVGIWRVSIGTEMGDGARVAEVARTVPVEAIPSPARQAVFHSDVGRALMSEARTRDAGLSEILRAERLAPQRVRSDVFVREAVADTLRRARRDAGGRDLRGLAWRMGVAPIG